MDLNLNPAEQVLQHLTSQDGNYLRWAIEQVLEQAEQSCRRSLVEEEAPVEVYRYQGAVRALMALRRTMERAEAKREGQHRASGIATP